MAKHATPNGVTSFAAIIPRPEDRMRPSDEIVAVRISTTTPTGRQRDGTRSLDPVEDIRSLLLILCRVDRKGFHVVYDISGQKQSSYNLTHSREILSWFTANVCLARGREGDRLESFLCVSL